MEKNIRQVYAFDIAKDPLEANSKQHHHHHYLISVVLSLSVCFHLPVYAYLFVTQNKLFRCQIFLADITINSNRLTGKDVFHNFIEIMKTFFTNAMDIVNFWQLHS